MKGDLRTFIKVMKALSDPRRLMILKLLLQRAHYVGELQTALDISQSATSSHLKLLEHAGLIESRKEGLHVHYYPSDGHANLYAAALLDSLRYWLRDEAIEDRNKGCRQDAGRLLRHRSELEV